MKFFKIFLPAVAVLALAQSCITDKYITEQTIVQGVGIFSRTYVVKPGDWARNEGDNNPGSDNYLYANFENPDITRTVIENGTVQAFIYVIYNAAEQLGAWNPLPFSYPMELIDESNKLFIAPEVIRFEFEPGRVTFILQDLDGIDPENITNDMTIMVHVTV
ncbi:MAG: hypothetical protein IJQ93_13905 [Bacteroidales bacterium]|nr:hypothetical protein [Bacteroidales bacterium]